MKKFKFKVGDEVRGTYPGKEFSGVVIARGRYTVAAEKFRYTAGDHFYLIETSRGMETSVEYFLTTP
jgi:hypothetical protein